MPKAKEPRHPSTPAKGQSKSSSCPPAPVKQRQPMGDRSELLLPAGAVTAMSKQLHIDLSANTKAKANPDKGKISEERRASRAEAKAARQLKKSINGAAPYASPPSVLRKRKHDVAYDYCCKGRHCSVTFQPVHTQHFRNAMAAADIDTRRLFVGHRLREKVEGVLAEVGDRIVKRKTFYLESPGSLPGLVFGGKLLPTKPTVALDEMVQVCDAFFKHALGISQSLINQPGKAERHFVSEPGIFQRDRQLAVAMRAKPRISEGIVKWMQDLAMGFQQDPTTPGQVFLPMANREVVYDFYKDSSRDPEQASFFEHSGGKPASLSWFRAVWRTVPALSKFIKLRRWLKFSLCDDCIGFREDRANCKDAGQLAAISKAEKLHFEFVRKERVAYWDRRSLAEVFPRKYLSMIIDGADQAAYGLPYHHFKTHSTDGKFKIALKVLGALCHGRAAFAYTCLPMVKQGTNVTIETMHRIMVYLLEKEGRLPSTFYLQFDNTSKQCKSQYMLGWLGCLVGWGLFKEIVVSYLPVGHTHEDIDQFFSALARYLRFHNARSRPEMHNALRTSYTMKNGSKPVVDNWDSVANISDWLKTYLADFSKTTKRRGIKGLRQFKIFLVDGAPVMQVREHCVMDEPWRGLNPKDEYTYIFKGEDGEPGAAPHPSDLSSVPPSQRPDPPKRADGAKYDVEAYFSKKNENLTKGVRSVIIDRKIPADAATDLEACLSEVESRADLPFAWDTTIYENAYDRLMGSDSDDDDHTDSEDEQEGGFGDDANGLLSDNPYAEKEPDEKYKAKDFVFVSDATCPDGLRLVEIKSGNKPGVGWAMVEDPDSEEEPKEKFPAYHVMFYGRRHPKTKKLVEDGWAPTGPGYCWPSSIHVIPAPPPHTHTHTQ